MYNLSIVSGTYNRITHLQKMVESVRQSIRFDLTYEIVLVDGGSIDGTIDYCKQQSDIHLIEHDQLHGAVKAFNDGAFAAQGDYVIMANDDIEFVEDSIYQAWLWMQTHPDCGVGCFYQDRDKAPDDQHKWHVETMPVVRNGKQSNAFYGQICIVPKWLGNRVHWWCNPDEYKSIAIDKNDTQYIKPLHTYAGDCELSSQVYELGFQVLPIGSHQNPLAKIHDNVVEDGLRKLNNIRGGKDPKAVRGHHPDSWSWGRKWRNLQTELVGANIKDQLQIPNQTVIKPRILYLPIYEPGWDIQKTQKHGLRDALERVGLTVEYDYMNKFNETGRDGVMSDIVKIIQQIKPTLILTQLHNGDILNHNDIGHLRKFTSTAKFVNWNGDYWPEQCLNEAGLKLVEPFDLVTHVNRDVIEKYQSWGINSEYWQIGFEPDGIVDNPTIQHDIVFLASGYSAERQKFAKWLKSLRNTTLGLYGNGWPDGWSKGQNLYNFTEAAGIYLGAKIALGDSQWPDSGFVSNRIMQILAAGGCILCHQWFRGYEHLGLIDGVNCVIWRDHSDLEQKIKYYLNNESERAEMAKKGQQLAFDRHSFDVRVRELFEILEPKEVREDDWRW